jgi:hypothetical protein
MTLAYKLDLPPQMQIHPVFHLSLLTPYYPNTFPGRIQPPPPPVEVENQTEWEVQEILDSRIRWNKLEYFVDWVGYGPDGRTWEPADNLANSLDIINDYHTRYPNRPSPNDLLRRQANRAPAPAPRPQPPANRQSNNLPPTRPQHVIPTTTTTTQQSIRRSPRFQ